MPARLKTRYLEEIRPALIERFGYSSPMQAPRIEKVTINMGVGDAKQDSNMLDAVSGRVSAGRASRSPSSRSARGCRSASRSRFGASARMSSSIA
jgi:large subunit ribosomal protein L5